MVISLKKKKLQNGRYSLYIEYYKGSTAKADGKRVHLRDFEYLKLYPHQEPKTATEKKENKEIEVLAEQILSIRKAEYFQGKFDIKNNSKSKTLFLEYYSNQAEERIDSAKNYGNWTASFLHLKRFCSPNVTFNEIDEDFVKSYRNYLDKDARTKSDLPLSQNSKYSYYNKFKAAIRAAFEDGYLTINPVKKVKGFEQGESQREYLTYDELVAMNKAHCKYDVLKRAFVFSCLVGLRWSDINTLVWSEVRDEGEVSRVNFRQEKTESVEYLYISKEARSLLGERENQTERVFKGLKYGAHFNAEILRWCMKAGITKHITFHSARHTNAVLLLENGADIYTVSKRLGHKELKTTEIYAKIIDSKMKEAANLIPNINI
ncbi:site-specific integrase [Flavobacterium sp. KACC 22761]|uniref:site-specific integrase n=1 Tax=Flavobacterium sp. KACC 22761 TaxID=3092665 RepID=UPI002A75EA20|nr:site-specific integrase [Flavobacterium sp. KACC 22761]WPO78196.1 site-specific integrase [Flavobacterium sp. KACC 22761]